MQPHSMQSSPNHNGRFSTPSSLPLGLFLNKASSKAPYENDLVLILDRSYSRFLYQLCRPVSSALRSTLRMSILLPNSRKDPSPGLAYSYFHVKKEWLHDPARDLNMRSERNGHDASLRQQVDSYHLQSAPICPSFLSPTQSA